MTKPKTLILIVLIVGVFNGAVVYGNCDATWTSTISTTGCPNLWKYQTWTINWDDGNTSTKSNEGFGQCCGLFTTTECWPTFNSPVQFPVWIGGAEYREWSQTVYDRNCSITRGCSNSGGPKTVTVTHQCSAVCSNSGAMYQCIQNGYDWDFDSCTCSGSCAPYCSPILIDPNGNGFALTNASNGIDFDLSADGRSERLGWTEVGSDDAFLALDRDADGKIDDGSELFGNFTPQPPAPASERNGFRALAEFDKPQRGGNRDGVIDNQDTVYGSLRLWLDTNHNGVSEPSELRGLSDLDVTQIELDYRESRRIDEHGNQFKYRSRVWDGPRAGVGRWAWDVFFVSQQ